MGAHPPRLPAPLRRLSRRPPPPPYFSPSHAASSSSPFDVGTAPFLRFRRAFLLLFSLASVVEGIQSVFGEDEFARCGFGREKMAARLDAAAAAALFLGGASGVVSDKL